MQTQLQPRTEPPPPRLPEHESVAVSGASFAYRGRNGEPLQALADVSLRAVRGELVAVVGPSGCGKSTLLELICGLRAPDSGSIACERAVLMPQHDLLLPWLTALDNAALALRIAGASRSQARERAGELFAQLGLDSFQQARPHELSGGMRQRVAFLRTLLAGKPVLCLDEPFGALDAITRTEMQEWLTATLATGFSQPGWRRPTTGPSPTRESRTVVFVTHDVEEAILLADRVIVLSGRPGRDVAQIEVDIEHPRRRVDESVLALREHTLSVLMSGVGLK